MPDTNATTKKTGFFASLKIGTRIAAGFAVVLVLLIAIGAIGVFAVINDAAVLKSFADISANARRVTSIDADFLATRRQILIYATSGDEKAVPRARELIKSAQEDTAAAIATTVSAERKAKLQEIAQGIDFYAGKLEEAVKLRATRDKLVNEQMNVLGPEARTKFSELIDATMKDGLFEAAAHTGKAQEGLMLTRLNAIKFLDKPDQAIVDRMSKEFEQFNKDVAEMSAHLQTPAHREVATAVNDLATRYYQAFQQVAASTFELDKLIKVTMAERAEAVANLVDEVVDSQVQHLDQMRSESEAAAAFEQWLLTLLGFGAVVLGALAAFIIARGIVRPVTGMTNAMQVLASGNTSAEIPARDRGDEIGAMAASVQIFKDNMIEADRLRAQQADVEKYAAQQRKAEMMKLADQFQEAVGGIINIVSSASMQLESAAQSLTKTADSTQDMSGAVAAASTETSQNVQSVATAAEQLSGTVKEISRQVHDSSQVARTAVTQAETVDARMAELTQAAGRIGDVVQLIAGVASQTNLLALNATIEAARAGEAGKGFAVVAQEVKALAAQTGKATAEIESQIAGMQTATQGAIEAIRQIGSTIGKMSEIATTIATAVEEQGAATNEIANNVQQAAAGTNEVADKIANVSRGAAETGSASSQVLASAQSLSGESQRLKTEVEKFLSTIRAA